MTPLQIATVKTYCQTVESALPECMYVLKNAELRALTACKKINRQFDERGMRWIRETLLKSVAKRMHPKGDNWPEIGSSILTPQGAVKVGRPQVAVFGITLLGKDGMVATMKPEDYVQYNPWQACKGLLGYANDQGTVH